MTTEVKIKIEEVEGILYHSTGGISELYRLKLPGTDFNFNWVINRGSEAWKDETWSLEKIKEFLIIKAQDFIKKYD